MIYPVAAVSLVAGLMAGGFYGDEVRRRKNAEAHAAELTTLIAKISVTPLPPETRLEQIASTLDDVHTQITAVSKALLKPAA